MNALRASPLSALSLASLLQVLFFLAGRSFYPKRPQAFRQQRAFQQQRAWPQRQQRVWH